MAQLHLDWNEDTDGLHTETPYGKASITEVRSTPQDKWNINTIRYLVSIQYLDGTIEKIPHSIDNIEGAKWIAFERLQTRMSQQEISNELTGILSTIDACRHLTEQLPNDHYTRDLDQIEMIIRDYFGSRKNK